MGCDTHFTVVRLPDHMDLPPLGRIALRHGIISREKLLRAVEVQNRGREMGKELALDDILLKLGLVSLDMLNRLFAATVRALGKEFGDIAVTKGFLSRENLEKALSTQAEEFKRSRLLQVGDILLESGDITRQQYELIMFGYQNRGSFQDIFWKRAPGKRSLPKPNADAPNVGEMAVKSGLISEAQLDEAMKAMEEDSSGRISLEEMLESKNMISREMMNRLVTAARRNLDIVFCEIAMEKGFVTREQAERALEKQRESGKQGGPRPIGEILVEEGVLSVSRCNEILKQQGRSELLSPAREGPGTSAGEIIPEKRPGEEMPELSPESETAGKSAVGDAAAETSVGDEVKPLPPRKKETSNSGREVRKKSPDRETLIGKLAVEHKFITREQLDAVMGELHEKRENGSCATLEQMLLEKELIQRKRMSILHLESGFLAAREGDKLFTRIAMDRGYLEKADALAALAEQIKVFKAAKTTVSVPEILLSEKKISGEQSATVMSLMEKPGDPGEGDVGKEKEPAVTAITVSDDLLTAFLQLPPRLPRITVHDVKSLLERQEIAFGVATDGEIEAMLTEHAEQGGKYEIARGIPPKPGRDAEIRYHFNKDYLRAGTVSEDGLMDFRDRGDIPRVSGDDLLAQKIPMVPGENGKDVLGNTITVPETSDLAITAGNGTRLSENGLKLFAEIDGTPDASLGDRISVFREHKVDGDVSLKTGHVRFDGNIGITGSVQPNFEVKGNHVTAFEVIGARIEADGDVNISSGIIDAHIKARGTVRAKFVSNSLIEAFGDLVVQRGILDSTVLLSGACVNAGGEIISSTITARKGFEVRRVGTDVSAPCVLSPGLTDHMDKQLGEARAASLEKEKRLTELTAASEEMESEQTDLHKKIAELTLVMERLEQKEIDLKEIFATLKAMGDRERLVRSAEEVKRIGDSIAKAGTGLEALFKRQDILAGKIERINALSGKTREELNERDGYRATLTEWAKRQPIVPRIKATGTLMDRTVVIGPNSRLRLKNACRNVMIREVLYDNGKHKMQLHEP